MFPSKHLCWRLVCLMQQCSACNERAAQVYSKCFKSPTMMGKILPAGTHPDCQPMVTERISISVVSDIYSIDSTSGTLTWSPQQAHHQAWLWQIVSSRCSCALRVTAGTCIILCRLMRCWSVFGMFSGLHASMKMSKGAKYPVKKTIC